LASFVIPFFLRSAHRFFMSSESRFLPSLLIPPRRFLFAGTAFALALGPGFRPRLAPVDPIPTRALIAFTNRSRSFFKSATILSISK
jgi:hypothetical protein